VDSFTGSALTPTDSKQEAYALIVYAEPFLMILRNSQVQRLLTHRWLGASVQ
jgi:hypothetical protein